MECLAPGSKGAPLRILTLKYKRVLLELGLLGAKGPVGALQGPLAMTSLPWLVLLHLMGPSIRPR